MNLTQRMEIAEAIVVQSKRTKIPVKMFLGLMRTESNFTVRAVSNNRAMGIMQIHPIIRCLYGNRCAILYSPNNMKEGIC
jgi:hypothetical protein